MLTGNDKVRTCGNKKHSALSTTLWLVIANNALLIFANIEQSTILNLIFLLLVSKFYFSLWSHTIR